MPVKVCYVPLTVIVLWSPLMLRICMVYVLHLVYRVSTVVAVPLPSFTSGLLTLVLVSVVLMNCPCEVLTSIGHLAVPNCLNVITSGKPRLMSGPENLRFGLTTTRDGEMFVRSMLLIRPTSLLHMLPIMLPVHMDAPVLGMLFVELVS